MAFPTGVYLAEDRSDGTTAAEFFIRDRSAPRGGLLPLEATIVAVGTFDSSTWQLQAFLGGVWTDVPNVAALASGTEMVVIDPTIAPRAPKFRFSEASGLGGQVISITLATAWELAPVSELDDSP